MGTRALTSRPRKPSAEARLAEIRRICIEAAGDFGLHPKTTLHGWWIAYEDARRIYRLTAPARGRKR